MVPCLVLQACERCQTGRYLFRILRTHAHTPPSSTRNQPDEGERQLSSMRDRQMKSTCTAPQQRDGELCPCQHDASSNCFQTQEVWGPQNRDLPAATLPSRRSDPKPPPNIMQMPLKEEGRRWEWGGRGEPFVKTAEIFSKMKTNCSK